MDLSLIEKELRSKLVAGVKNSKEDGKFFWNDNQHDYPGSKGFFQSMTKFNPTTQGCNIFVANCL